MKDYDAFLWLGLGLILFVIPILILYLAIFVKPDIQEMVPVITKDGCTIYRWYDKGERMYITKCGEISIPIITRN